MTELIITADAAEGLRQLDPASADMCVTSPPYYGLRDYGIPGQIGLETTPGEYIEKLVAAFREARRVLKSDGTLWVVIGDSYAGDKTRQGAGRGAAKPKDLIGIPWMLAFALRDDGWHLRQDIIWAKPNPMPESVKDRCTRSHEHIFMLSKSPRYYCQPMREPAASKSIKKFTDGGKDKQRGHGRRHAGFNGRYAERLAESGAPTERNRRDVWMVATHAYPGAHFATYPPELIRPCVLAGSRPGGTVLDPFFGTGTTGLVAAQEGRGYAGIEISPGYAAQQRKRIGEADTRQKQKLAAP